MKNLPLLLLGAGAVYFIAKKPAKVSSTASTKEKLNSTSDINQKGYTITNCSLKVNDLQKSLDYAYESGVKYGSKGPDYIINLIFGLYVICITLFVLLFIQRCKIK